MAGRHLNHVADMTNIHAAIGVELVDCPACYLGAFLLVVFGARNANEVMEGQGKPNLKRIFPSWSCLYLIVQIQYVLKMWHTMIEATGLRISSHQ